MLEAGVSQTREPIHVEVGKASQHFEDRTVTHAIYATGWDGNVVLEATGDGVIRVVSPAPVAVAAGR
jgi:hypothetical protein